MPVTPSDKLLVTIRSDQSLKDAVCAALHPDTLQCEPTHLYQALSPSIRQETSSRLEGEAAFAGSQWRAQIGVMLG